MMLRSDFFRRVLALTGIGAVLGIKAGEAGSGPIRLRKVVGPVDMTLDAARELCEGCIRGFRHCPLHADCQTCLDTGMAEGRRIVLSRSPGPYGRYLFCPDCPEIPENAIGMPAVAGPADIGGPGRYIETAHMFDYPVGVVEKLARRSHDQWADGLRSPQ